MIDEERLKLMTRMASFEDNEGRKAIPVTEFFRSDYVGFHMLLTVAYVTVAFMLITGMNMFCGMESFLSNFYKTDFLSMGKGILNSYLVFVGFYVVISFIVYSYRYTKAKKSVRVYQKALKRLGLMYEK